MKKKGGAAARARTRAYEISEEKWWAKLGATTQLTWRQAVYIGPGRLITKPKDFFDAFDLVLTFPSGDRGRGATAWVQVTESPFEASGKGGADRNAAHGEPPFPWAVPPMNVEEWAVAAEREGSLLDFHNVQVIVSYANPKKPERRWWFRKGAACPAPDSSQRTLDDTPPRHSPQRTNGEP